MQQTLLDCQSPKAEMSFYKDPVFGRSNSLMLSDIHTESVPLFNGDMSYRVTPRGIIHTRS